MMSLKGLLKACVAATLLSTSFGRTAAREDTNSVAERQTAEEKLVFCHFMVRILHHPASWSMNMKSD